MYIIHTADLHLGSALTGIYPADIATKRRKELADTFLRMVSYAAEYGIRAILIAGDLFDTENASPTVRDTVLSAIREHPAISFYYLRGNHDTLSLGNVPENLFFFGKDFTAYSLGEGIMLYGAEEPTKKHCEELSPAENNVNLVMLHGQTVESGFGKYTVNLRALQGKHIDYLALGHLHTHKEGVLDLRGSYVYAGTPEPRGFDEAGEKGFYILKVERGLVERRFVPFSMRTVHIVELPLSPADTEDTAYALLEDLLSPIPDKDIVRLILSTPLPLSAAAAKTLLSRFFYSEVKQTERKPVLGAEAFLDEISLRGEFVRLVLSSELTEEEKNDILHYGLSALRGEEGDAL